MSEKNQEIKSGLRVSINTMLIGICFTVFTLIWTLDRDVEFNYLILSQLAISIPLLLSSTVSYSKVGYRKNPETWNSFAVFTYLTGYSLILNSVGLMIYVAGLFYTAVIFFVIIWILEIIYSIIDIAEDRKNLKERIVKNTYMIFLQFVLGLGIILMDFFT